MSATIDKLLSDFIDAWNAGRRPRLDEYLARAAAPERAELAERLEEWLTMAPSPTFDTKAQRAIRAEPALVAALAAIEAEPGLWPDLLPRLRERAGLRLRELAARVTAAFGLAGEEERAEQYLGRMESGDLDASRVSRRLLETLGAALGVSGSDLVRAGGVRLASQALFRAEADAAASFEDELDALSRAALAPAPEPMDELDRLFVGGPDA